MFSGSGGWGGQGGCERRFEVFVKFKKNHGGGGVGEGVRADVNEELKLLWKCKKKYRGWGCQVRPGMGCRGMGLADREGVGWQQCWG